MPKSPGRRLPRVPRPLRKKDGVDVRRSEFNQVIERVNENATILQALRSELDLQFKRIAQLQAQLDVIQRAWAQVKDESARAH